MELKQIKEGLYSLNGNPLLNDNLVIAMHPYFLEYNNYKGLGKEEEMKKKKDKISKFLIRYSGPKIILEEEYNFTKTLKRYEKEPNLSNLFLIKTGDGSHTPFEISYDKMLDHFQEMSGNKKIFLIGGYYWKMWWNKGCLGSLRIKMKERGLQSKVIPDLTFS
jgi:hypothetical protein